jgi:hypothetical protein
MENHDVNAPAVLGFGVALMLAGVIALVMLWQLFAVFRVRQESEGAPLRNPTAAELNIRTGEPRLQINPREDLRQLRAREDAVLNSYGWVDRANGVVHIPVRDAVRILTARGLPSRRAAAPPPQERR